jgi:hypothetical protein
LTCELWEKARSKLKYRQTDGVATDLVANMNRLLTDGITKLVKNHWLSCLAAHYVFYLAV